MAEVGAPAAHPGDDSRGTGMVRTVACRGHAFDEHLLCPCGTTWSAHQASPRRCRLGAQRCKRADAAPSVHPVADAD